MKHNLSLIVAMDKENNMGIGDQLPWKSSADMRHFKQMTEGKILIVGSTTFKGFKRPLKDRVQLVLTSKPEKMREQYPYSKYPLVHFVPYFHDALDFINYFGIPGNESMVIGGLKVYKQALPYIRKAYISIIDTVVDQADCKWDIELDDSVEVEYFDFAADRIVTEEDRQYLDRILAEHGHWVGKHRLDYRPPEHLDEHGRQRKRTYIGRGSRWGNKFTHLDVPNTIKVPSREIAVLEFRDDFLKTYDTHEKRVEILTPLRHVIRTCYCGNETQVKSCDNQYCHGHVLSDLIQQTFRDL